jgi:hypothetical protein
MRRCISGLRLLALLLANAPALLFAANVCDQEAQWVRAGAEQYFMILAGRTDVFYDRSGPTFVVLMKTAADEAAVGAFGIYSGASRQPVFGPVPASVYEPFLYETRKPSDLMLRLSITGPQYQRALEVLQTWDRRVREQALLYPEIALDNILLVKQVTEELNRCSRTLVSYELDWGLKDDISENNTASRIPYEYFRELKRLNGTQHIPDDAVPAALLTAGMRPTGDRPTKE